MAAVALAQGVDPRGGSQPDPAVINTFRNLPLRFEANQGQTDPQVKFLSRGSAFNLFLTADGATVVPSQAKSTGPKKFLKLKWIRAGKRPDIAGIDLLPGKSNYLLGNSPDQWKTGIPLFAKVRFRGVYPGVDVLYHGDQGSMEYDALVAPGADPNRIRLRIQGSDRIRIGPSGDLLVKVGTDELRLHKPVIYQFTSAGTRQPVDGGYTMLGGNTVGFAVGAYDRARELVIDPQLTYSSYLGGSGTENGWKVALDPNRNAVIVGTTMSADFPTVNPRQATNAGGNDVFVAKINPEAAGAASLLSSSYLGGSGNDFGRGVAVDAAGLIYVAGDTNSANFPVTSGAFQTSCKLQGASCSSDVFAAKLDSTGSTLLYSTYLGGTGSETGFGLAVDTNGNIILAGPTGSTNFPVTTGAFQTTFGGGSGNSGDGFIAKLNPAGGGASDLVYSTYLGGSGTEQPWSVAVDSGGVIYAGGATTSGNFPVTAGAFNGTYAGAGSLAIGDGFVVKLNPGGQGTADLLYSTLLGGANDDRVEGVAVDSLGKIYATGFTQSTGFPVTSGTAFQAAFGGGTCNGSPCGDAFLARIDPTLFGTPSLVYSTFFGGNSFDLGHAIAVSADNKVFIAGETGSLNFPLASPVQSTCAAGCTPLPIDDAFVAEFDLSQSGAASLLFSTYLGGRDVDTAWGLAVDSQDSAYITGQLFSPDFPTLIPYQTNCDNCASFIGPSPSGDGFLTKFCTTNCPAANLPAGPIAFGNQAVGSTSSAQTVALSNPGSGDLVVANIGVTGTNAGDFSQSNTCPPVLGALASCNVQVQFSPSATGSRSASLTVGVNIQGTPPSVALTGTGIGPVVGLAPGPLSFGNQTTNTTSAAQTITVTNQGPGTLTISSISITGANPGDFGQTNNCPASLTLNATCTISVTFTPLVTGNRSASISITDNGTGSPQSVNLSGTGTGQVVNPWPNGYTYQATFTVAAGKVPSVQTNFPALISGTFADLKTVANGGRVANTCTQNVGTSALTVPCDLIFTSDAAGASPVSWEFESYNAATGAVIVWVNVPSLSNGSVIYGWYGNSAVTTLQTTPSSAWSSNFLSVYHLKENPAGTAPQVNDSTVSALNASAAIAIPAGQQVPGEVGGSIDMNRAYDFTLGTASTWNFERTDSFSVSCWCLTTSNNSGDILAKQQSSGSYTGWEFFARVGSTNPTFVLDLSNNTAGGANRLAMLTPEFAQNTWHHVVATYSGGSAPSSVHIYVDGTDQPLTTFVNTLTGSILSPVAPNIGSRNSNNALMPGRVDEARVYAKGVVLSSDWVKAEYNNQSNPSTFFGVTTGLTNSGSAPVVGLSPTSLSFGSQMTNTTSAAQTVTVTNQGPGTLTISSISITGANAGDFGQTNTCPASLTLNATCTISVTFTPLATGSRSASVSISDNGTGSPQLVGIGGTGTAPVVGLSPTSLSFGSQTTNTTSTAQTITVTNQGPGTLTISSISITGANAGDFGQTNNCPASLTLNATCTISVTFTPLATGSRSASVSIADNGVGSPQLLGLSGTGTAPVVGLSPTSLSFGSQTTNTTSAAQTLTVTNQGPGTLTISSISITGANAGDFAQTNNCPVSLTLNATCTINVTFKPLATGSRGASVSIADNGIGSPQLAGLGGTGTAPTINPWPNGFNYQATFTVAAGKIPSAQTNFPALISGTFADLKTVANGGRVANTCTQNVGTSALTVPCDLIFTSDAAGASPLSWEFESYNAATGAAIVWVNVPTLSNGSVIYGWYGNAAVTTLQTTPSSAWSSNFLSVYHLKENPAGTAPQVNDSTVSALNASAAMAIPAAQQVPGEVGGSIDMNRAYDFTLGTASTWNFERTDSFSVSCWCLATSNNSGDILAKQQASGAFTGWAFFARVGSANPTFVLDLSNNTAGGANRLAMLTPEFAQNTWHHVVATYSGGSAPSSVHIYVDGTDQPLTALVNTLTGSILSPVAPNIGSRNNNNAVMPGRVDEARVYAKGVVLSPDWVTAEYNNQSNPAAFFGVTTGLTNPGSAPVVGLSPTSLSFGNQMTNTTSTAQTVTVTNQGPGMLAISSISITGANPGDFGQTNNCPASLTLNATCTISVTFTPLTTGSRSAGVSISDSGTGSPQLVGIGGTGTAPVVGLSPTSLSFGSQTTNTTSTAQTITVTNQGPGTLSISSISITGTNAGDFGQTNNCPASLTLNATCTVSVTFTPLATGSRSASVSIADNGVGSPQLAGLSGTGIAPPNNPWSNGYTYQATFTVAAGKVPSAQTNFPVLISGTFADLKTVANGGRVANTCTQNVGTSALTVPCDLIFTSDAAGASPLSWEFESYNAATGAVIVWVNVPSLSSGSVIYGWYGNLAVTALQTTPSSAWNSNFLSVYHLKENPAGTAPQVNDSTVSALNASAAMAIPAGQQVPGEVGGSIDMNRAYDFTLGTASTWNFERTDSFSVSCWCLATSNNSGDILAKQQASGAFTGWAFFARVGSANPTFVLDLSNNTAGGANRLAMLTPEFAQNTWHHVVATYSGGSAPSSVHIYVDGTDQPLTALVNTLTGSILSPVAPNIGSRNNNNAVMPGRVDEARVYAKGVVLSPDWVTAEYNNQSNPAAFLNVITGLTTP